MNTVSNSSRAAGGAPGYAARATPAGFSDIPDDFRLDLADIPLPRNPDAMRVDGFNPTLFMRLFGWLMPRK
jgi:hypothetical protein